MESVIKTKREITLGAGEANIKALIFILPVILIFGIPYFILWHGNMLAELEEIIFQDIFITLIFIVLGAVIHELIHGIFWSFYLSKGFRSIKFGVAWKFLTPYCHSKEPLKLKNYRLGAAMPGIILGIGPLLISLFTGNMDLFAFGFFFTVAAGGDILMLWMLRKEDKNGMVQDHPDKIGCIILT